MPRTYKPKGNKSYKKYDDALIDEALKEYNSGTNSLLDISKKYNITKSVLYRHNRYIMKKQGGQPALTTDEEKCIVEYINTISEWGYSLEIYDIRLLIKGYLDGFGFTIKRFKNNMPGLDFIKGFLKRNEAKITRSRHYNNETTTAEVSKEIIEEYFRQLQELIQEIPLSNIVSYDEINLSDNPIRKSIIVKRSVRHPEKVMNHIQGSTSVMIAAAANGPLLPPYVVYKAENLNNAWTKNGPDNCQYNITRSGWLDGTTFLDWIKTVIFPYFKGKRGAKILIGDNLVSYLSIDLIKECIERNIRFVFVPANSSHLTQPLEVAFFKRLEEKWREILDNWKKIDGRTQDIVPKNIFPSLLKILMERTECNIHKNVLGGFKKTGLSPFNNSKVVERLQSTCVKAEYDLQDHVYDISVCIEPEHLDEMEILLETENNLQKDISKKNKYREPENYLKNDIIQKDYCLLQNNFRGVTDEMNTSLEAENNVQENICKKDMHLKPENNSKNNIYQKDMCLEEQNNFQGFTDEINTFLEAENNAQGYISKKATYLEPENDLKNDVYEDEKEVTDGVYMSLKAENNTQKDISKRDILYLKTENCSEKDSHETYIRLQAENELKVDINKTDIRKRKNKKKIYIIPGTSIENIIIVKENFEME